MSNFGSKNNMIFGLLGSIFKGLFLLGKFILLQIKRLIAKK